MSYQFGTNWSVFSDKTGPVLGPLMGYEVMSAFFLEAGFLGVMLYGFDRVGRVHAIRRVMLVASGMPGIGAGRVDDAGDRQAGHVMHRRQTT